MPRERLPARRRRKKRTTESKKHMQRTGEHGSEQEKQKLPALCSVVAAVRKKIALPAIEGVHTQQMGILV
jgi:hypothetical protein